jgi:hypothetical protein
MEDVFPLLGRSRIIEVKDDVSGSSQGLERTDDEVLAALAEDLNRDILRDEVLLNEAAAEVELDLGSGGKADLDLLEADADQHEEVFELFLHAHGLGEGLVAVAEIDAAPDRSGGEATVWPLAVGEVDSWKRPVFGDGRLLHEFF